MNDAYVGAISALAGVVLTFVFTFVQHSIQRRHEDRTRYNPDRMKDYSTFLIRAWKVSRTSLAISTDDVWRQGWAELEASHFEAHLLATRPVQDAAWQLWDAAVDMSKFVNAAEPQAADGRWLVRFATANSNFVRAAKAELGVPSPFDATPLPMEDDPVEFSQRLGSAYADALKPKRRHEAERAGEEPG